MTNVQNIYEHPRYYDLDFTFPGEEWRQIPGAKSYYLCSNIGRVKTIDTMIWNGVGYGKKKGKIISAKTISKGYYQLQIISIHGMCLCKSFHQAVALTWVSEKPSKNHVINHIDGNKWNNRAENLEWLTYSENIYHAVSIGTKKSKIGIENKRSKPICQMDFNGNIVAVFSSSFMAQKISGFNHANILKNCNNKTKSSYGFNWSFITKDEYSVLSLSLNS